MNPEQFCYWLQGFAELQNTPPSAEQWKAIQEHLQTVFQKVTPPVKFPPSEIPVIPSPTFPPFTQPTYPGIGPSTYPGVGRDPFKYEVTCSFDPSVSAVVC